MNNKNRKAFSMMELIFVIVIIGILSAVAIPKFAATRDDAIIAKARTTVSSVRSAISTERQKQILKGDFHDINKTAIGETTTGVFSKMLEYEARKCTTSITKDCWTVGGSETAPTYTYKAPNGVNVDFNTTGNKFNCQTNCENFNF